MPNNNDSTCFVTGWVKKKTVVDSGSNYTLPLLKSMFRN